MAVAVEATVAAAPRLRQIGPRVTEDRNAHEGAWLRSARDHL